jgi:beta-lactam-binding protein with PASTA domain/tRNA A-37 threonylcarbamoyl transferase component Bud32
MATVYLATDLRLERRVAIKIMHGHLADDVQFRERFIQEAHSAARLAHPNVVNVYDQGQDSDMAYLVMEYLPGITLRDLLDEHTKLTAVQTLDILEAVLSGLAAAHQAGIVHRDLKPENVLLADDGRIKIGDFGLARAASANTATGAALLGTIAYLSPELVTRGIADTRSDIYAVGIMMYEMLTGEQPFKGEQPMQIAYQHANDSVPMPSAKNSRVPAELDELVLWATAREPDERPRDARALLEQLAETKRALESALPTAATSVMKTSVLPATLGRQTNPTEIVGGNNDQTQVLDSRSANRAQAAATATGMLATKATRRKAKGRWLLALVVLLAGLAGGTGWYFGSGPGSLTTIPSSIVGQTPANAENTLTELGLAVANSPREVYSPTVEAGLVASTQPAVGSAVARDAQVRLEVSLGPEPVAVPAIVGAAEADALTLISDAGLVSQGREVQFSSEVAAGTVIAAYGEDDAGSRITLANGDSYFDQKPVTLLVSLGAVPDVAGMTVEAATAALTAVSINVDPSTQQTFSDDIDANLVISATPSVTGASLQPNDTVILVVSRGPDLVDVPNVVGERLANAVATLEGLGFTVEVVSEFPEEDWNKPYARVASSDPGEGQERRGATITLRGVL